MSGLIAEAEDHGWFGVAEAVDGEFLPLEAEGAHGTPSNWLETLDQVWPFQ